MTACSYSQKTRCTVIARGSDCYYLSVPKWTTMAPRERLLVDFRSQTYSPCLFQIQRSQTLPEYFGERTFGLPLPDLVWDCHLNYNAVFNRQHSSWSCSCFFFCWIAGRGRSHGPHKFYIPVVPRRHSFDERIFAAPVSKVLHSVFN